MRIMLVLAKDNIYRFDSLHQRKYYPQITLITLESLIDKKYNAEIVLVDEVWKNMMQLLQNIVMKSSI